ncbi:hypothetical protein HY78_15475 [Rhizorhabdus wittichii DC-6]|nr:hypothetical protein HY78_15475 [Rhizorhabdus wittichii DC-6]
MGIFDRHATIFQLGYVTDDLDHALAGFRGLGVERFRINQVGAAAGLSSPHGARIAMAWAGDVMIEVIEPQGIPAPVYVDDLPPPGSRRCVFNHVGLAVPDHAAWQALRAELDRRGLPIAWHGSNPAQFDVAYVDTRPLTGHYSEFIRVCPVLAEMFASVPRNGEKR